MLSSANNENSVTSKANFANAKYDSHVILGFLSIRLWFSCNFGISLDETVVKYSQAALFHFSEISWSMEPVPGRLCKWDIVK